MRRALLTFIAFGASSAACDGQRERTQAWAGVSQGAGASDVRSVAVVSDSELKPFLPDHLGQRVGSAPQGMMTRMGDRALTEVTRSYRGLGGAIELKLADARLEPRAAQAIETMADEPLDAEATALRVVLPGAIGYARYDEGERVAQAQVVIAGRFIASATIADAQGAQEAATALRSVDTLGLAKLARAAQ